MRRPRKSWGPPESRVRVCMPSAYMEVGNGSASKQELLVTVELAVESGLPKWNICLGWSLLLLGLVFFHRWGS